MAHAPVLERGWARIWARDFWLKIQLFDPIFGGPWALFANCRERSRPCFYGFCVNKPGSKVDLARKSGQLPGSLGQNIYGPDTFLHLTRVLSSISLDNGPTITDQLNEKRGFCACFLGIGPGAGGFERLRANKNTRLPTRFPLPYVSKSMPGPPGRKF